MKTLEEPTADQAVVDAYNKGMAASDQVVLTTSTKYAMCLLRLAGAVTPADYPTIKTSIEGVAGVQEITLLVDHETRADVPTGKQLVGVFEANVRIEDTP